MIFTFRKWIKGEEGGSRTKMKETLNEKERGVSKIRVAKPFNITGKRRIDNAVHARSAIDDNQNNEFPIQARV